MAENILPATETYCNLGLFYEKYGLFDKAGEVYTLAGFMIPTRITPTYRLWKLYQKTGDTINARKFARKIVDQPVKIKNTFSLRVKGEAGIYLKESEMETVN